MRHSLVVLSPVLVAVSRRSAARPMTIADLLGAVRVSDPQLSPDGRTVAFVRTTTDVDDGEAQRRHLGRARGRVVGRRSCSSAATRRRTRRAGRLTASTSPSSPTVTGEMQIYVADADGRNVRQVTKISRRRAAADGVLAGRFDAGVRVRREAGDRHARQRAHPQPSAVSALGRVARERAPPRVRAARSAGGEPRDLTPGDFDSPPTQQEDAA